MATSTQHRVVLLASLLLGGLLGASPASAGSATASSPATAPGDAAITNGQYTQRRVTVALGDGSRVVDGTVDLTCAILRLHEGWVFGERCEGTLTDARGTVVHRGVATVFVLDPSTGVGGLVAKGSTGGGSNGKSVSCPGNQRTCGPGGRFHGACLAAKGGYSGSNPDSHGIPQTWSCTLP